MKPLKQSLLLFKKLAPPAGCFRKAQRTLALAFSLSLLAVVPPTQANAQGFPVNNAPSTTPTQLLDVTTPVNTPVTISFMVNDVEDDAVPNQLTVLPDANVNPVIADSGLSLARSGVNNSTCTLTMTPLPGAIGEAIISVAVRDNGFPPLVAIKSFKLTVTPGTSPNNPPIAGINVSRDADLDGGDPEIILISVNGVDALATLDGSASTDPDPGDVITSFAWYVDSVAPPPFSEDSALATRLGIGAHQIYLSVSDGDLASPFTIKHVKVITITEAIRQLIATVDGSSLTGYWKRTLRNYLLGVSTLFTSSPSRLVPRPCEAGIAGLRFFDWLVGGLATPGPGSRPAVISSELAAELNHLTDQIINNVTCE